MLERQKTRIEVQAVQAIGSKSMIALFIPYGQISVPAETYARLDEWARWARPRQGLDAHGRCASAEGRYDSVYPDAARGTTTVPLDLPAVLAVERVVCTKLPSLSREIIRRHFVCCDIPQAIARALGIHRTQYGNELKRSVLMVKNRLTGI